MAYVYKHTNNFNGKVYIGWTSLYPEKRWKKGWGYKAGTYFFNAIQKYGWDNFTHEILFDNLTDEEAKQKEIELIALYDSTNSEKGYNCTTGGEGSFPNKETRIKISKNRTGIRASEETKRKISESNKGKHWCNNGEIELQLEVCPDGYTPGRLPFSADACRNMGNARIGCVTSDATKAKLSIANKGRKLTKEHCEKISKGRIGIQFTDAHRLHISESRKGKGHPQTAEAKEKIRQSKLGEKNPSYGKHLTEEEKELRRKASSGSNNGMYGVHWHWYNNGVVQTLAASCPVGYKNGRLPTKRSALYKGLC